MDDPTPFDREKGSQLNEVEFFQMLKKMEETQTVDGEDTQAPNPRSMEPAAVEYRKVRNFEDSLIMALLDFDNSQTMIDAKAITPKTLTEWRDAFESTDYQSVTKIPVQVFIEAHQWLLEQGADKRAKVVEAKGLLLTALLAKYVEVTPQKNVNPIINELHDARTKHGLRTRHKGALETIKETLETPVAKAASALIAAQGAKAADYYSAAGGPGVPTGSPADDDGLNIIRFTITFILITTSLSAYFYGPRRVATVITSGLKLTFGAIVKGRDLMTKLTGLPWGPGVPAGGLAVRPDDDPMRFVMGMQAVDAELARVAYELTYAREKNLSQVFEMELKAEEIRILKAENELLRAERPPELNTLQAENVRLQVELDATMERCLAFRAEATQKMETADIRYAEADVMYHNYIAATAAVYRDTGNSNSSSTTSRHLYRNAVFHYSTGHTNGDKVIHCTDSCGPYATNTRNDQKARARPCGVCFKPHLPRQG